MPTRTLDRHIEATPDVAGGQPRIAGRRITVKDIAIWSERVGMSPDQIATEHELTLAQVYAALAYYFDHIDEIALSIQQGQLLVDSLKRNTPSKVTQKLGVRADHGVAP